MSGGYEIFLGPHQVLSVTTHRSQRGQQNFYVNALGANTHGHLYVPPNLSGTTAGHSLKDRGAHSGPASVVSAGQAQEFLTVHVRRDPASGVVSAQLASHIGGSPQTAHPAPAVRAATASRERLDLPVTSAADIDLGFRFVPSDYEASATTERILRWSKQARWAVALEVRSASTA
jgi:hypothetical protein